MEILVDEIFDPRPGKNPNYKTLQLRASTIRNNSSTLNSRLLGGNYEEKRVAHTSIRKDVLLELALEKGDDFGKKLEMDLRLTIRELTYSEWLEAPEEGELNGFNKIAFKIKTTPDARELCTSDGETIYRSVKVTPDNVEDKYVEHVRIPKVKLTDEKGGILPNTAFDSPSGELEKIDSI